MGTWRRFDAGLLFFLLFSPVFGVGAPVVHGKRSLRKHGDGRLEVQLPQTGRRGPGGGARCAATTGTWCQAFLSQDPISPKEPPHGNKTCLNGCNHGAGVCNYDTGLCGCMAGFRGDYCQFAEKRPCTQRHRDKGWSPDSHLAWEEPGWTDSRCSGTCDEDRAICYCKGKFGRVAADPYAPAGTPPKQAGRPMPTHCTIAFKADGQRIEYLSGEIKWEDIYGPEGWCESPDPKHKCPCLIDGVAGDLCEIPTEQFCLNHCSGHGECRMGFCMCHGGYYGHDCARRAAGFPELPGDERERPWLTQVMVAPPAAAQSLLLNKRLRPLIYVYDLPPEYNSRMLEYRVDKDRCVHRGWDARNGSFHTQETYMVETMLHEVLLQSPHRTLDPEEADFFYVPVYTSCFIHPIMGFADHPWYYGPGGIRVNQAAMMALEAKRWLETHLPYWNRKGGADHIWLFPHDEGPCWAPMEVWNSSIILSHWGRKDASPRSNSAYWQDNYTMSAESSWNPEGYTGIIGDHPCYDPERHLVIPAAKNPYNIGSTPLFGAAPQARTTLLFFRGDFRSNSTPFYSRGIRQSLRALAMEGEWAINYNISIGTGEDLPGPYDHWLSTSKFCLVAPGDGWSPRAEDAVLHGCIPVVIMDNVDPVFGNVLEWAKFSVRIAEADVARVPDILMAISNERLLLMQRALARVWKRFMYSSYFGYAESIRLILLKGAQDLPEGQDADDPDHDQEGESLAHLLDSETSTHASPNPNSGPEASRDPEGTAQEPADRVGNPSSDALNPAEGKLASSSGAHPRMTEAVHKKQQTAGGKAGDDLDETEQDTMQKRDQGAGIEGPDPESGSHPGQQIGARPRGSELVGGRAGNMQRDDSISKLDESWAGNKQGVDSTPKLAGGRARNEQGDTSTPREIPEPEPLPENPDAVDTPVLPRPTIPAEIFRRPVDSEQLGASRSLRAVRKSTRGQGSLGGPAVQTAVKGSALVTHSIEGLQTRSLRGKIDAPGDREVSQGTAGPLGEQEGIAASVTDPRRAGRPRARVRGAASEVALAQAQAAKYASLPAPYRGDLTHDDAVATILGWLYSKIPADDAART